MAICDPTLPRSLFGLQILLVIVALIFSAFVRCNDKANLTNVPDALHSELMIYSHIIG